MKKILSILTCTSFFVVSNAQTNDVKAIDAFVKKVNNKLITIKAAEYVANGTTSYQEGKPMLDFTVACKFQFTPFDSFSKYSYIHNYKGVPSSLYSYLNDISLYNDEVIYKLEKDTLYVTDLNKYSDKVSNIKKNPNAFVELLSDFMQNYGVKPGTKTEITNETKNNINYHVISYTTTEQNDSSTLDGKQWITTKTSLYVTDDYLPVKMVIKEKSSSSTTTSAYTVESYKLLESIPDEEFLPQILGNYKNKYHYQGDKLGYVLDDIKQ